MSDGTFNMKTSHAYLLVAINFRCNTSSHLRPEPECGFTMLRVCFIVRNYRFSRLRVIFALKLGDELKSIHIVLYIAFIFDGDVRWPNRVKFRAGDPVIENSFNWTNPQCYRNSAEILVTVQDIQICLLSTPEYDRYDFLMGRSRALDFMTWHEYHKFQTVTKRLQATAETTKKGKEAFREMHRLYIL